MTFWAKAIARQNKQTQITTRIISMSDLKNYPAVLRAALRGSIAGNWLRLAVPLNA